MLHFKSWVGVVFLAISALSLQGCRKNDYTKPTHLGGQVVGNRYCDKVENLVAMGFISPRHLNASESTPESKGREEPAAPSIEPLYAALWAVWPTRQIPVCWEDDSYDAGDFVERLWVQEAVTNSWEAALCDEMIPASECLKFVGWTQCSEGNDSGIRLQVIDAGPHAVFLGKWLAGIPHGVRFNFTFANWSPACAESPQMREHCIRALAVHEFGHALGLAHEQNRGDTPGTCDEAPQGSNGNTYLGPWDENSVMNYCSPQWNNDGELSDGDKEWIKAAYYPEYYDELCIPLQIYDPALM